MKEQTTYRELLTRMAGRVSLLAATACLACLSALGQTAEPEAMIKDITASSHLDGCDPSNLLEADINRQYHSKDENASVDIGDQYIEVSFKDDKLKLNDDEDMVVYVQRCPGCDDRQPTVFRVMGQPVGAADDYWEPFCHVYFLFRGKATKEYSARIHPEKEYQKLRFYVVENNSRSCGLNERRSMGMAAFQIYKVKRDGYYPAPMADQFHLRDDYNRTYEDYTFVKTMGWLDPLNRDEESTTENRPLYEDGNINNEAWSKGAADVQKTNIEKLNKWADWSRVWSPEGNWTLNEEELFDLGVQMPSMAPITNDPDFDPAANMRCQPTHVTEHILYALPGDPIILIPYGNFAEAKHFEKYEVNFAHWYDYRTGDRIVYTDEKTGAETNLLDFLADPWAVSTSKKDGFFGSYLLTQKNGQISGRQSKNYGMFATFFCPRDPFTEEGVAHSLPFRPIDKKKDPNDVNEFVIAADFSQSFNKGRNLKTADEKNKQIIEPNIAFRHIFRIRDGKEFAEDFSGSDTNNAAFVQRNRRDITARAGKEFQIGLDIPVPRPWDIDGRWRSIPSDYYYKLSDSDYRRINAMRLKVTEPNGNVTYISNGALWDENSDFFFAEPYDGLGERDYDGANYKISGGGVADRVGQYYRMLRTKKSFSGKYKVEIIGQEIINQKEPVDIKVYGSDTPLVVMEFDIDFVDNEDSTNPKAILVSSERLHTDSRFEYAREEKMIEKYGKAKDRIDFDYYRGLENLPEANQYLDNRITGSKHYQFRWPAAWNKSQYANGYSNDHNYNMYVVANHTSRTPYHNFWHHNDLHRDEETSGLYDRLHDKTTRLKAANDTVTVKNGYFLYVNAASDPGVMVNLNVDNLCTGSTVHVSAWIAELSKEEEMANVVFNFVAVLANGDRVNLHSFVSGYIPRNIGDYNNPSVNTNDGGPGQWMNVNYSFNPDVSRFSASQVDHYELELENNCKSSSGADYAVDDISIYIMSPVVTAEQVSPLCIEDKGANHLVRIETPFTETLQSIDVPEATGDADGEKVKVQYVILDRAKFDKAYADAEKAGSENPGLAAYIAEGVKIGSGIGADGVVFNSNANKNLPYNPDSENIAGILKNHGVQMLAFNTNFADDSFRIGKEYYISLYVTKESDDIVADWSTFDITDPCAKFCLFKVKSKNNLRVDGELREQTGEISVCEGESPEVSIDLATPGESNEEAAQKYLSAYCDWFLGTRDEYDAIEEGDISLFNAMTYFREAYPEATSPANEDVVAKGAFTDEMRQFIIDHSEKLIFRQKSYKFPAIMIPEGEDEAEDVVLVLPIPVYDENELIKVCTAPMEIRIHADMHAPKLLHGLHLADFYPETMGNAPLRIGLDQINSVTVADDSELSAENALLMVPIRSVETSGVVTNVKAMRKTSEVILLESTTDPNYDMEMQTVTSDSGETYLVRPEYEAGRIYSFVAQVDGEANCLGAVFNESFKFREGYEYTLSYRFREAVGAADANVKLCDGRTFFTIKVVPEYMVWESAEKEDGTNNRNWNNDCNWKRVSAETLYADLNDDDVKTRLNDKVTDGSNNNTGSFSPLGLTKVIVPGAIEDTPWLYDYKTVEETPVVAGDPTPWIEYDMVATDSEKNVDCGLWAGNVCAEIHFQPAASIMNQQHLTYGKAWVDLELDPYRWYTLAMPLKKVFAGEFYLPSANGRQETELFSDIKFNIDDYDRFKPAVFQRGWDKSTATTYCPDGTTATAVVKANWSHVYNDVAESYGSGTGFSIKTDMTVVNAGKDKPTDKVMFRLPKADTGYQYYDSENNLVTETDSTTIDHGTDHYRLNPTKGKIVAETANNGSYFLVGNPFMTYLDMKKFLEKNSQVEPKYWLVTSGNQKAAVFDEDGVLTGDAEPFIAPMQGFFVKANGTVEGGKLELEYDEEMMADAADMESLSGMFKTRGGSSHSQISVMAENGGECSSTAFVVLDDMAAAGLDMPVLDNSDLDVRATVYTVSDGKALSVNRPGTLDKVELGLIALPDEETVLRFGMQDTDADVMLLDAATGEYTELYDGMTYTVTGNVSGRLYLTAGIDAASETESGISCRADGGEVTVTADGADEVAVRVYDYAGRCVVARSVEGSELRFTLAPGAYVIEAEAGDQRRCIQVII